MTWQQWLSVAGSIGSILSGLTLFGALIGWTLRNRAANTEDRLELARHLDRLIRRFHAIRPELDEWVKDLNRPDNEGALLITQTVYADDIRLDVASMGKARGYADYLESIFQGFTVSLTIDRLENGLTRKETRQRYESLIVYMMLMREVLRKPRKNPVKELSTLPSNAFYSDTVAREQNRRYFERRAREAADDEAGHAR